MIIIAIILILPALFFPPILLLNLPLLYLRHAYRHYFYNKAFRLKLSFECAACHNLNPASEKTGKLPIKISCCICNCKLQLRYSKDEGLC